jgi:hypothetical protein
MGDLTESKVLNVKGFENLSNESLLEAASDKRPSLLRPAQQQQEQRPWEMYESSGVLPVNLSGWYRLRWAVLSPFHTRVSCGQRLGEYTLGEIILVVPIVLILCALNIMHFASGDAKSVEDSGSVAVLPLIAVFVLAARNSPLAFLIGIPFERAIFSCFWAHCMASQHGSLVGAKRPRLALVLTLGTGGR